MPLVELLASQVGDRFSHPAGSIVDIPLDEAERLFADKAAKPAAKGAKATHVRQPSYAEQPETFAGPIVPRATGERPTRMSGVEPQKFDPPKSRPSPERIADRRPPRPTPTPGEPDTQTSGDRGAECDPDDQD